MATIITSCQDAAAVCINTYADYTSSRERLKARAARVFFRLCGSDELCYTVKAEMDAAVTAGTLKILDCGKVIVNEPSQNTETDDYGCADKTFVVDYSWSVDAFFRYHPDNDAFLAQICDGQFAEFGWVDCNNLVYLPPVTPEISVVGPIDDGGSLAVKITATWTQDCGIIDTIPARSPLAQATQ